MDYTRVCLEPELVGYRLTLVGDPDERRAVYHADFDFPSLAASLGWRGLQCHSDTDGSIPCPRCGREFIPEARDWLDNNCGEIAIPHSAIDSFPWEGRETEFREEEK